MYKTKVLFAVHQLNLGGVQKAAISALDAIDYNKNEVTLYIRKDRVNLLPSLNKNISKIIINQDNQKYYKKPYAVLLQIIFKITKSQKIKKKLYSYIIDSQIKYEKDTYFSNDFEYDVAVSYIQGYTAKLIAENVKAKCKIMFFHGSTDEHHEIHKKIMPVFQKIYCVSKEAQKEIQQAYPEFAEKIFCLANYVDPAKVKKEAMKFHPAYPGKTLIICTCGRITSVKGFDLAVGAAEKLSEKKIKYKWYFIGDGPDRNKIEHLISEKNLNKQIEITGLINNPYPYIKHCNIYVQPSYEEAQGLTIIEAQILQKPVISTSTAGAKSLIRNNINGVLSDIDSQSIAENIIRLTEDKSLQEQIYRNLKEKDYQSDRDKFIKEWDIILNG